MGNNAPNRQPPLPSNTPPPFLYPNPSHKAIKTLHHLNDNAHTHSRSAQFVRYRRLGGKPQSQSLEIEVCTYRPVSHKPVQRMHPETVDTQISRLLRKMATETQNTRKLSKRELEEFLEGQAKFVREREQSIERSRQKQRELQGNTQQKGNKHTIMLAARKRTQGVVKNQQTGTKRLLQLRRDRHKSSYQPIIPTPKHPEQPPIPTLPTHYLPSTTSQSLLKDYLNHYKQISPNLQPLSYVEMCQLMNRLNFVGVVESVDSRRFIKQRGLMNDMWLLIAREKKVDGMSLLSFLMAVLGVDFRQWVGVVEKELGREGVDRMIRQSKIPTFTPKKQNAHSQSLDKGHDLFANSTTPPKSNLYNSTSKRHMSTSNGQSTKKKIILKKNTEDNNKSTSSKSANHLPLSTIFEILEKSRQSQMSEVNFGSRKQRGYIVYRPSEIEQIAGYFKQFAETKIHNLKNHRNGTQCYTTEAVDPYTPTKKSLPKSASKTRDFLAQKRKERIVEAAKKMKIIKQAAVPKNRLELMQIEQKLKQKLRQSRRQLLDEQEFANLTFQPNTCKAKSPLKRSPTKQSLEPLFKEKQTHNEIILHIDIYVDDKKYELEIRELDNPNQAASKFLEANKLDQKWKKKLIDTIGEAISKISKHNSPKKQF